MQRAILTENPLSLAVQMRIYLAGPLFTVAEREFNARLKEQLEKCGHSVWLPQEHESPDKTARHIFDDDVAAIDGAEAVVANMDGPDPDSGTCWECGYAYAKGKQYLLFRTDFRVADKRDRAPFNPMLAASASRPPIDLAFADLPTIVKTIDRELAILASATPSSSHPANQGIKVKPQE
jgi:nucleoside 2-deoxyribosyltransferase